MTFFKRGTTPEQQQKKLDETSLEKLNELQVEYTQSIQKNEEHIQIATMQLATLTTKLDLAHTTLKNIESKQPEAEQEEDNRQQCLKDAMDDHSVDSYQIKMQCLTHFPLKAFFDELDTAKYNCARLTKQISETEILYAELKKIQQNNHNILEHIKNTISRKAAELHITLAPSTCI